MTIDPSSETGVTNCMIRNLIISPCGTSILTNGADAAMRDLLTAHTNDPDPALPATAREAILRRGKAIGDDLGQASLDRVTRMSAELNAIVRFYGGDLSSGKDDYHLLIHSDSFIGTAVARVLEGWFTSRQLKAELVTSPGLRTQRVHEFEAAAADLVYDLLGRIDGYRNSDYRVVLNLTGGFKAVQAVLTPLGMAFADEIVHVFESGRELLRIPRLPVRLAENEAITNSFDALRRIRLGLPWDGDASALPEGLVLRHGDRPPRLSAWGEYVFKAAKEGRYEKELHPAVVPHLVRYSARFLSDVAKLPPRRKQVLNERLDELGALIHANTTGNPSEGPRSLRFHALSHAHGGSTHEFYPYDGSERAFGHFEGKIFVVDRLGPHL